MMIHKYKLKMIVDGVEHEADLTFNETLNNVFNKRKKRYRDYGIVYASAISHSLSGYLTYGVGITNDAEIPLIPQDTNFTWRGLRNIDYTNITGVIDKVVLTCERIGRDTNKTFYTEDMGTLCNYVIVGQNIGNAFGEAGYGVIALGEDGETMYGVSTGENSIKLAKFVINDMRWGLDGLEGGNAYTRGQKFKNDIRTRGMASVPNSVIDHSYTYNFDAKAQLFDVDEEVEHATIGEQTVDYYTWNCFLNCRNDFYGTSNGTSLTQDDDYIYIFEYLLGAVVRLGQYNPLYSYRPANCDYYYNMSTKKIEGLGNIDFQPLLNYAVISKETMEVVQQNSIFLNNTISIDLSNFGYTGTFDISRDTQITLNENTMNTQEVIDADYPFRLFATCADGDYVYLTGGYSNTTTSLWRLNSSNIQGETLPETLSVEQVSTGNIENFCHTINRKNLYKTASKWSGLTGEIGYLINKKTGIVNWVGFIDWLVSAEANFNGVTVNAGQTVRFELVEDVESEE